MPRIVEAETLDHLQPDDPAAVRSRRDLLRVHAAMRTRAIVCAGWQALVPPRQSAQPLRILELGAGDGRLLLGVAQRLATRWPRVQLTLLDRLDIVSQATLDGYAALGWTARALVTDVLAWADEACHEGHGQPGGRGGQGGPDHAARWDLVSTALFLHHFETDALRRLLAAVAARSDAFFAVEPHRAWPALAGSHLVALLGANAVTREDAVLSVRAGFRAGELAGHWPPGAGWQLHEARAGLFGHAFSARRSRSGTGSDTGSAAGTGSAP